MLGVCVGSCLLHEVVEEVLIHLEIFQIVALLVVLRSAVGVGWWGYARRHALESIHVLFSTWYRKEIIYSFLKKNGLEGGGPPLLAPFP